MLRYWSSNTSPMCGCPYLRNIWWQRWLHSYVERNVPWDSTERLLFLEAIAIKYTVLQASAPDVENNTDCQFWPGNWSNGLPTMEYATCNIIKLLMDVHFQNTWQLNHVPVHLKPSSTKQYPWYSYVDRYKEMYFTFLLITNVMFNIRYPTSNQLSLRYVSWD